MTIVEEILLAMMVMTINVGETWLVVITLISTFPSRLEDGANCVFPSPQPPRFPWGSGFQGDTDGTQRGVISTAFSDRKYGPLDRLSEQDDVFQINSNLL